MNQIKYIILFLTVISLLSCRKDSLVQKDVVKKYLFLSHTRTASNPDIYNELLSIDFNEFDMLLLGGDLAQLSSVDNATMDYLDSIFDLSAPNTLLSLGNHDYTDPDLLTSYTNKPRYYSYYQNETTFIVLDTQDSLSNIVGEQKLFLEKTLDTITFSKQVILLTHKLIWMDDDGILKDQIDFISNGIYGDCEHCLNPNNFYTAIYPDLVELELKNIQVLCLAGDLGFKVNEFEYVTPEGVQFIASGVDFNKSSYENKVVLFEHNISQRNLSWKYLTVAEIN